MFVLLVAFGGLVALAEDAPPGGLALMDAVRLTLANDPNVAIEAAQVDSARGALQIASGRFDPVIASGLTQTSSNEPRSLSSSQETRTLQSTWGSARSSATA